MQPAIFVLRKKRRTTVKNWAYFGRQLIHYYYYYMEDHRSGIAESATRAIQSCRPSLLTKAPLFGKTREFASKSILWKSNLIRNHLNVKHAILADLMNITFSLLVDATNICVVHSFRLNLVIFLAKKESLLRNSFCEKATVLRAKPLISSF